MDERRSEKPSRNDPCSCGADRKYKKSCERVEDERPGARVAERQTIYRASWKNFIRAVSAISRWQQLLDVRR